MVDKTNTEEIYKKRRKGREKERKSMVRETRASAGSTIGRKRKEKNDR
jgi:hypothetical protein